MSVHGYVAPRSLSEAINILTTSPAARVLGGGQELLIGQKPHSPSHLLVDLGKVPGLSTIEAQPDGGIRVGAMATLAEIAGSSLVRTQYPVLGTAALIMGDAQLRNRATLGGHFASADPDADLLAVVLALDADLEVVGPQGPRTISASQFILGPRQTILGPGEVLVALHVPAVAMRSGVAYERLIHPATLYALCGVAANVTLDANGRLSACFVAVTGAAEYPTRLRSTEKMLIGKQPDAPALRASIASTAEGLTFRTDLFASAEYRRHLTRVLTERSLAGAVAAAREKASAKLQAKHAAPAA